MPEATVEIKVGSISFSGSGTEAWVSAQLEKFIDTIPSLVASAPDAPAAIEGKPESGKGDPPFTTSLAAHIKAKGGDTVQVKRFLATADWLRQRGTQTITTADVTKALSENHQKKLANPADCLGKNISKGLCEKTAGGFYIAPAGLVELGYPS